MTVIAYSSKHRVMAADSRFVSGASTRVGSGKKIFRLKNGCLCGAAGEADTRDLMVMLGRMSVNRLPSRDDLGVLSQEIQALLVYPSGIVARLVVSYDSNSWRAETVVLEDTFYAIGSGADFAYGAMESGASPKRAVEIACKRDTGCGLPVQVESL